jgi:hypothetical protein
LPGNKCLTSFSRRGKFEKEKVMAERYNAMCPDGPRVYQTLMTQWNKFANNKPPTVDPDCPLACHYKRITDKAGFAPWIQKMPYGECDPTLSSGIPWNP